MQRGDQGKFFKNRPKSSPRLKGPKELWHKCHYPLIQMHLNCKNWKRSWRKERLKKCLHGQVMAISQGQPKPAFSEKGQRGDQGKFLKKRPKNSPPFKGPKANWQQMSLSYNLYALKLQRLEKILAQTAAPKVPEWPSYGNFRNATRNTHFLKNCKGGTKGKFSKIA